jgi:predicted  nucleic acid-binding Zn-ribbon protein
VQELKEQLLAERSWWQNTSAAQVTQQVDQLRRDVETQQVTLAKIAEHLLANGAPQMQSVEASLNEFKDECRAIALQQQQTQELQANALREGLLEIHEQRAALEKEISQARERREGREGSVEVGQPLMTADTDLQAWVANELSKLRSEVSEATSTSRRGDLHEAVELHTHLAEELANAIHRFEEQRHQLSKAIEAERFARTNEVTELRKSLADTGVQKMYIEKTIGAFLERSEEIEQKLASSKTTRDSHNLLSDIESLSSRVQVIEASTTKGDANGPPMAQVMATIRDAQEVLRFEFAARLAEVEMKMRDQGHLPTPPRADADELAQRLEAIKSQLRAEIEKRIERSPNSALMSDTDSNSSHKRNVARPVAYRSAA